MFRAAFAWVIVTVTCGIAYGEGRVAERLNSLMGKARSAESAARRIELANHLKSELDKVKALKFCDLTSADLTAASESCQLCGRYEESVAYANAALEIDPSLESANRVLIQSLVFMKRLDEASSALESAKHHVCSSSWVRGLHSVIYFQAGASKDWQNAFPQIDSHMDYLADATRLHPQATMRSYFWVDQFALACKNKSAVLAEGQQLIDARWGRLIQLKPSVRPPWQSPQLRDHCAVLELQSAIEVHTPRRADSDRLSEWASAIATFGGQLKDDELVAETMVLGQFLHDHHRDLEESKRSMAISGLNQIQADAAFRVVPSPRIKTLHGSLEQIRRVLKSGSQTAPPKASP